MVEFFGAGRYVPYSTKGFGEFIVTKFSEIAEILIPFFNEYKIVGSKFKDYQDFVSVTELMKNKAHLTEEGLNKIRLIKSGMNTGRQ